jgi:hypothetical protein
VIGQTRRHPNGLAELDDAALALTLLRAQVGLIDPLPVALIEVLEHTDHLQHFVAVRRSQEVDDDVR